MPRPNNSWTGAAGASELRAGDHVVCSASTDLNARRGYTWSVTGGTIVSGQYTHKITIDTSGLPAGVITITAANRAVFAHIAASSWAIKINGNN